MTPMMTNGSPLSEMVLPMMLGSAENRLVQRPWLSTATFSPPGRSSSGVNVRPIARAKQAEVVGADFTGPQLFGELPSRIVDDVGPERRCVLDDRGLLPPVRELRWGRIGP